MLTAKKTKTFGNCGRYLYNKNVTIKQIKIMVKYKVTNIDWDVDEIEDLKDLPTTCIIDAEDEDDIADALSDEYGFCVNGFSID